MDLNTMMRETAEASLQRELATATTDGDIEKVKEITTKITALALASVPAAPPYGQPEIKTAMEKAAWFGVDPEKTATAIDFGKSLNMKKFATADAFADALIKSVEAKFKPAAPAAGEDDEPGDDEPGTEDPPVERKPAVARKTDGPNEGDNNQRGTARRASGPWTKLSDAPPEIRKEVNRTADKFAPKTKEGRESFVTRALGAHYAEHQRKTAKK